MTTGCTNRPNSVERLHHPRRKTTELSLNISNILKLFIVPQTSIALQIMMINMHNVRMLLCTMV